MYFIINDKDIPSSDLNIIYIYKITLVLGPGRWFSCFPSRSCMRLRPINICHVIFLPTAQGGGWDLRARRCRLSPWGPHQILGTRGPFWHRWPLAWERKSWKDWWTNSRHQLSEIFKLRYQIMKFAFVNIIKIDFLC